MNTHALKRFRRRLLNDEPCFGLWITLESASLAEMAVALDLDWIVIDAEHGHMDLKEVVEHIRAAVRSKTVALVRIAELNGSTIKRVLDVGADGIVVPWVESADQLHEAVQWATYPPYGKRGIGGERATLWGQCIAEHVNDANGQVMIVPLIESVRGGQQIESMLDVPGVDVFFFGPADYSSTAGYPGQWEGPGVADLILGVKDQIRQRGKSCGLMATSNENVRLRLDQGFQMIGLGSDAGLMLRSLHQSLALVGRDRSLSTDALVRPVDAVGEAAEGQATVNESLSARIETIVAAGDGKRHEIAAGVVFEELAGRATGASLTSGMLELSPSAGLTYHTYPFDRSVTLLEGAVTIEVDGRVYHLEPFDNVTIPKNVPHTTDNGSTDSPARLFIAMATDQLTSAPANLSPRRRIMAPELHGRVGPERITRFARAQRRLAGDKTWFVDYCNDDLLPNITIGGGCAEFHPWARSAAMRLEGDSLIFVVRGEAKCVVDGRPHVLKHRATVTVPSGQPHYVCNETDQPATVIWFNDRPRSKPTDPDVDR